MSLKEVTEVCPHCETEITMLWDTTERGFQAHCPVCSKRLMLCDECQHTVCEDGEPHNCDYSAECDTCHRRKNSPTVDLTPADQSDIRSIAYLRYQMWWCLNHGITLPDIFAKYSEYWGEVEADDEDLGFEDFIGETGFHGGQLWACKDEFLDCEYQDADFIRQILDPVLFQKYAVDRVTNLVQLREEEKKNE